MMPETDRHPDAIERDIDRTRGRIDKNVDELNSRLSADGLVDEAAAYLRDGGRAVGRGLSSAGESVGRMVRDHPVPAALICAGVAWLVVSAARGSRTAPAGQGSTGPSASVKNTLAGAADSVQEGVRTGAQAAMSRGREVKDPVADTAQGLRERAAAYGTEAGETARDVFDRQPLLVGVLGLAVGGAIGLALPHTRREDDVMGAYRDRLGERVKDYGREQRDRAERAADAAVAAAREELDGDGTRTPSDDLEGSVSQVADKVTKAAKAAAKAARDEVATTPKDTLAG